MCVSVCMWVGVMERVCTCALLAAFWFMHVCSFVSVCVCQLVVCQHISLNPKRHVCVYAWESVCVCVHSLCLPFMDMRLLMYVHLCESIFVHHLHVPT